MFADVIGNTTCIPGCDDERVADPLLELADRGRVRLEPVRPSPGERGVAMVAYYLIMAMVQND